MDHRAFQQLAAGEALEDLGRFERLALAIHSRTCGSCRRLRGDLDTLAGDLSLLVPARRPPAALRASVMAAVGAAPGAAGVGQPTPLGRSAGMAGTTSGGVRRWQMISAAAVGTAVVLAVVAAGLGATALELERDLDSSLAALERATARLGAQTAAVEVALAPGHVTAPLVAEPVAAGATAFVVFRPGSDDAYLMAMDLPPTPAGRVYQLWFADAAGVHPLGTFTFDGEGTFVAPFGVALDDATAAMVTLEPAGGTLGAPGPQVVFGEL